MKPNLERLEDRAAPTTVASTVEVVPPPIYNLQELALWVKLETFIGQIGLGIPWHPGQVLRLDVSSAQMDGLTGQHAAAARTVILAGDGQGEIPVLLVPPLAPSALAFDLSWEYTSLNQGWWYADWDGSAFGNNPALMPPGPQFGQAFQPPNYQLADTLLISGNSSWWFFI